VGPMLGFKRFFNARRVLSGVELVHKIIKGQFGLPESFGTDPFHVWYTCSLHDGCAYLQQIRLVVLVQFLDKYMMYKCMIHLASALPALCRQYRYPGFWSGGRLPCQRCEVELTFLDLLC
jgi:hypothetical protein